MRKLATTTTIMVVAMVFLIAGFALACNKGEAKKTTSAQLTGTNACQPMGSAETTTASATDANIVLSVTGMTNDVSVKHITKSLAAIEGVSEVIVSMEEGTAKVSYDDSRVKPETLTAAVVDAGYKAEVAQVTDSSEKMTGEKTMKADAKGGICTAKKCCDAAACPMKTASNE